MLGEQRRTAPLAGLGQVVLVLQGGGALGAYQPGVYEALHEAGVEPDWVIGTSIGAINAALIAGNPEPRRLEALREFWARVQHPGIGALLPPLPGVAQMLTAWNVIATGLPGFFAPNPLAFMGTRLPMQPENAGYYSTRPLRRSLADLVDFEVANGGGVRLTVGAANVATGEMRYFDSRREELAVEHVLASGALPPAFPAVRIDGALYWDGGVLSNTPVEAVFDDNPRRDSIVFAVHMWRPEGPEPDSIWHVANRQKDLQYASRATSHIRRQRELHRLRRIIAALGGRLPAEAHADREVREMLGYGCTTRMHVVRLLAPRLPREDHLKDIDFSAEGISARWEAGRRDMRDALAAKPWQRESDPHEGFVLHEMSREDAPVPMLEAAE